MFIGSPVFGMILEVFGLLNLFGNMFPVILAVAKTMPGIGPILNNIGNNNKNDSSKKESRRQSDRFEESSVRGYDDAYGESSAKGMMMAMEDHDDKMLIEIGMMMNTIDCN